MTELTFAEALKLARRWWWVLMALPLLAAIAAYALSTTMTPMYNARASLLIDATQPSAGSNYNDLLTAERLSRTYSELATTDAVLEETAIRLNSDLTADDIDDMTSVSAIADTQLLQVAVTDSDPGRAAEIANTLAMVFTEQVQEQRATTGNPGATNISNDIAEVRAQIDGTAVRISELELSPNASSELVQTELRQLRTLLNTYQTTYAGLLEIQQRYALASAESAV
ncbi:MAG: capsular biosynthesis protein, partial [Chloroflexia bacterium]|nr:capsular biosynthesis protein [Chloroflexia bacterium]